MDFAIFNLIGIVTSFFILYKIFRLLWRQVKKSSYYHKLYNETAERYLALCQLRGVDDSVKFKILNEELSELVAACDKMINDKNLLEKIKRLKEKCQKHLN